MKVTGIKAQDIRFPTSKENLGTDAVHVDCDYSATYVTIVTEDKNLNGIGLTFTIGKGNDLCCKTIEYFKEFILNKDVEDIETNILEIWKKITNHSQLRWVGPSKGVTHLAAAAFFNAIWDLISKYHEKPFWRYIIDLETDDLVNKLCFSYLDDVITKEEAKKIINNNKQKLPKDTSELNSTVFPAYTTAVGWLGYSDDKMVKLAKENLDKGWTHFKMKVGQNIERDIHRCKLIRNIIGDDKKLMVDSNQIWSVNETIEYIGKLKEFDIMFYEEPTNPDDILGFKKIKNAHPDIKLATGEMIQNAVMFKQFIENKSLDYCQIDSCRIASINEILPVLLIASKFNIPVIPHAGGVGLCEYVQHLNLINKFIITNNSLSLSEYAESCSEHFENPAKISNGGYVAPTSPGYSVKIKDNSIKKFDYNEGTYWN